MVVDEKSGRSDGVKVLSVNREDATSTVDGGQRSDVVDNWIWSVKERCSELPDSPVDDQGQVLGHPLLRHVRGRAQEGLRSDRSSVHVTGNFV